MAVTQTNNPSSEAGTTVQQVDLAYDPANSEESARRLVCRIQPQWKEFPEQLQFVKFTDGITNTLLKIARLIPGASQAEIDADSILMRAYGNHTDLIIDRDREAKSHALLANRGMAPPLLARFQNGLLYRYIPGKVTTPEDLIKEPIWRGIARKLGEWHARVPISAVVSKTRRNTNGANGHTNGHVNGVANRQENGVNGHKPRSRLIDSRSPKPNIWTVIQGWIEILPSGTDKEKARKELLQAELERCFQELDSKDGLGEQGLIFGHCDLLSANVIVLPTSSPNATSKSPFTAVTFIDYEYATPCPAAFDIANHFAEWAGYDLDYNRLPSKSTRRAFLHEYVAGYNQHARIKVNDTAAAEQLYEDIERFRGMPGLYWGVWALIQARISEIDFDYASYAEDRLSEYWAWRSACDGSRPPEGKAVPLREQRWNHE